MACFSPQNFQLWLIATCFPYARDRFDEDRICELGFALCLQISLESRPTRDSRGLPELGFIFEFQLLVASWLDVSALIIGCLKCTLKDIESQVLLLGPLSSRTQQRSSHVANRDERIKPCKTHIFPWSKNPFCNPHDMCEWLWKKCWSPWF